MIWVSLATGDFSRATMFSGITSILMLGKSGAESYLTFSRMKKLDDTTLLMKLKLILKLSPMFATMAGFRLGSLSVIMVWD